MRDVKRAGGSAHVRRGEVRVLHADEDGCEDAAAAGAHGVAAVTGAGVAPKAAAGACAAGNVRSCPVERMCGACQHVGRPYAEQLAAKEVRVAALFADVAPQGAIRPILGMDEPYHYRNKVVSPYAPGRRLAGGEGCGRDGGRDTQKGRGRATGKGRERGRGYRDAPRREILCGMYAAGSHRIVPTDGCLIENEEAKRVIRAIRDLMGRFGLAPYDEDAHTGFLRHAVVRVGHESGEMLVTLVTNGREFPASRAFCRELVRRCPVITTIVQNVNERRTNVILGQREQRL